VYELETHHSRRSEGGASTSGRGWGEGGVRREEEGEEDEEGEGEEEEEEEEEEKERRFHWGMTIGSTARVLTVVPFPATFFFIGITIGLTAGVSTTTTVVPVLVVAECGSVSFPPLPCRAQ
jgi:hypothetical protein